MKWAAYCLGFFCEKCWAAVKCFKEGLKRGVARNVVPATDGNRPELCEWYRCFDIQAECMGGN